MAGNWQVSLEGKWVDLELEDAQVLAIAEAKGALQCVLRRKRFKYTVDFRAMTQTNNKTGTVRSLRKTTYSSVVHTCHQEAEIAPRPFKIKKLQSEGHEIVPVEVPYQIWLKGRWRDFQMYQAKQIRAGLQRGETTIFTTLRPGGKTFLIDLPNLRQTKWCQSLPCKDSKIDIGKVRHLRRTGAALTLTTWGRDSAPFTVRGLTFGAEPDDPVRVAFGCAIQEYGSTKNTSDFERSRIVAMEQLLSDRGWSIKDVQRFFCWSLLPRDAEGWSLSLPLQFPPGLKLYSSVRGVRFNLRMSTVKVLLEDALPDGANALFSNEDVCAILNSGLTTVSYSLDPPDRTDAPHPCNEATYAPASLAGTDYLATLGELDMWLKEIMTGVEVSRHAPFSWRRLSDGSFVDLPKHVRSILQSPRERALDSRGQVGLASAVRSWFEFGPVHFHADETTIDEKTYWLGNVEAAVRCDCLVGDCGNEAHKLLVQDMTDHLPDLAEHKLVLKRTIELVRLGGASHVIQAFCRQLREQHTHEDCARMLQSLQGKGYFVGDDRLELASTSVTCGASALTNHNHETNLACNWVPSVFVLCDHGKETVACTAEERQRNALKIPEYLHEGADVLAQYRSGHWFPATIVARNACSGFFQIEWKNGTKDDLYKSAAMLCRMGEKLKEKPLVGITCGGVKIGGALRHMDGVEMKKLQDKRNIFAAIKQVESRGDPLAVGDKGKALGAYQIWESYYKDAVEHRPSLRNDGKTYADVVDATYALEVVKAYMDRYANSKRLGHEATAEDIARIHNGGPNGHKNANTDKYWEKVSRELGRDSQNYE